MAVQTISILWIKYINVIHLLRVHWATTLIWTSHWMFRNKMFFNVQLITKNYWGDFLYTCNSSLVYNCDDPFTAESSKFVVVHFCLFCRYSKPTNYRWIYIPMNSKYKITINKYLAPILVKIYISIFNAYNASVIKAFLIVNQNLSFIRRVISEIQSSQLYVCKQCFWLRFEYWRLVFHFLCMFGIYIVPSVLSRCLSVFHIVCTNYVYLTFGMHLQLLPFLINSMQNIVPRVFLCLTWYP